MKFKAPNSTHLLSTSCHHSPGRGRRHDAAAFVQERPSVPAEPPTALCLAHYDTPSNQPESTRGLVTEGEATTTRSQGQRDYSGIHINNIRQYALPTLTIVPSLPPLLFTAPCGIRHARRPKSTSLAQHLCTLRFSWLHLLTHFVFGVRWRRLVLSCLVLSCLVLSCLVLSCLVLSCLVLSCLVLSCLVLSCLVLSCLVLSCLVLSCLVLSCLVLSCLVLSCLVLSCLVLSCLVLSCLVLSCLVLSCLVLSCLVLSCLVLSCLVLSCRVVSCRVVSCRVVSCRVVSCRVVSCRVVSCRVVSCRVVSCRVVSCRVVSCRVVSCRVVSTKQISQFQTRPCHLKQVSLSTVALPLEWCGGRRLVGGRLALRRSRPRAQGVRQRRSLHLPFRGRELLDMPLPSTSTCLVISCNSATVGF